jgi:DNA replication protein DnaC
VWIQAGIGLWLLAAPRGAASRLAGLTSAGWGLVVCVFGESFGGIFAPGLTWLFGAPGAALAYCAAGALVALPERSWRTPRLAERARAESWSHEEFLAACLQREVAARESHGGEGRIRAARFPARKSLEEFDFDHARGLKREVIAHLGTLDFAAAKENVIFLGPPGTGKTHLATGLAIRACQAGHRVQFATAAEWVARLAEAHHAGRLQAELVRLGRYPLLVIDEVGYIPFEPEAANLFFQLVSARYERASLIVTSNKPFGRWGETFGDEVVAAAMIDSSTTPR